LILPGMQMPVRSTLQTEHKDACGHTAEAFEVGFTELCTEYETETLCYMLHQC
jgi:hypothetical protein